MPNPSTNQRRGAPSPTSSSSDEEQEIKDLDTSIEDSNNDTPSSHDADRPIDSNDEATEKLAAAKDTEAISWFSLPRKDQLLVLAIARLAEPLTQTSLGTYLFYQLKSFDPSLPDSTISFQAGIIGAAFPGMQFTTAMLWGRYADYAGRKRVILIGLSGTMISMLGFGFSQSFATAVFFRCLGGMLNGNIGVLRTMISEVIKEKKYQARAFVLMPMTFNIGIIVGPILGGLLADPVGSYPALFGPGSAIGGENGVSWMKKWPYALPNLVSAVFLCTSAILVALLLEETNEAAKHKPDYGLKVGKWIRQYVFRQKLSNGYTAVAGEEGDIPPEGADIEMQPVNTSTKPDPITPQRLPFRRIFTRTLVVALLSHGILAMHLGAYGSILNTYFATPRFDPAHPYPPGHKEHGLYFTGGLALPPARIGNALAVLGALGIMIQFTIYPKLSHSLGTAKSFRIFLLLLPVGYFLNPFLSIIPSTTEPPAASSGVLVWLGIGIVLFIVVLADAFVLPGTIILINNSCPHPSVLGTVHGLGTSMSSLSRTFGPILWGWIFGRGLDIGMVGLAFWTLTGMALIGAMAGRFVKNGDGHEILLEGEVRGDDGVVRTNGR